MKKTVCQIGEGNSIGEGCEIVFRETSENNESVQDLQVSLVSDVNAEHVYISDNQDDHIVLGVRVKESVSSSVCDIGTVASRRWVASAKNKLWWMTPSWGKDLCEVPIETQFLLVELEADGWYAIFLPLIHDGTFTAMLRGGRKNRYVFV